MKIGSCEIVRNIEIPRADAYPEDYDSDETIECCVDDAGNVYEWTPGGPILLDGLTC